MGALLSRYKAGKGSLHLFNKVIPAVNEIVEQMETMEELHLGFTVNWDVDDNLFQEIEYYIEWILGDFSDDEQEIIRLMVNDRMCYEPEVEAEGDGEVSLLWS